MSKKLLKHILRSRHKVKFQHSRKVFMRYKVILFDIDGTLVRAGGAGRTALARSLQELHGIQEANTNIQFGGRTDLSIARELFHIHGLPWNHLRAWDFLDRYAHHLERELKQNQALLLPGIRPLLQDVQRHYQHGFGILTGNILRCARLKLQTFDLWQHFSFGAFGDRYESRADIAAHALEEAGLHLPYTFQAHEVLILGDALADIHCARSIGAHVLAVATGPVDAETLQAARPDYFLPNLEDTSTIMDILMRGPTSS